jgi:4-hydroxy-tetrahydrodipicolinate synthase
MNFQGCYVAIVTPFNEKNEINEEGLRSNIDFLIKNGVAGIVPCGTTGESATLSWEEHNRVVEIAIEQTKGRAQVIAGAGSNNTAESIAAAQHAQKSGADALLCITPYYNKPTQEGLYRHYRAIATQVNIPIVVYNVPGRTAVNILPETIERLCEFETISAVKEASADMAQISDIYRRCGDRIAILSGDDATTLPLLACGGKGVISVVANFIPGAMVDMVQSFLGGNWEKALKIHKKLLPLSQSMFLETNPAPVKAAMDHVGLHGGALRLPLVSMTDGNKEELIAVIQSYTDSDLD